MHAVGRMGAYIMCIIAFDIGVSEVECGRTAKRSWCLTRTAVPCESGHAAFQASSQQLAMMKLLLAE